MNKFTFMIKNSEKKIATILKLLPGFILLLAPLAYGAELAVQLSAGKPPQYKNTEQASKPEAPVEKQDCAATNCLGQKFTHRLAAPLGARISDALTRQDREAAVDILEHDNIPLNDQMNLLFLAGRKKQAADIAFTLMDRSSLDEQLYAQAAPILLANSRTSGVMSTYYVFDSYNAINTEVNTTGHQLGGLKLDFSYHQERRSNVDTTLLASAPDENGGEFALHQTDDSYVNTLGFQFSQSLNTQTGLSLDHQHQIGSRLKLDTLLAYNQKALENAAMRIIGRSHQIALESAYNIDGATQLSLGIGHNQYQTIDGQALGSGNRLASTLSHELSSAHPAMRTHVTGTWSQFNTSDQVLTGNAASLIPAGAANTAAYFMPRDVSEVAAYASLGDASDSQLPAHDLEYRCEIGVFHNTASGDGWRASTGLAGRVIGADRLHMFIRYDQSPNGQGVSSLEAGIAYLLHY